jgi:phospholipid/cholesterol/gamma-HCH transport system substrate-binding protein
MASLTPRRQHMLTGAIALVVVISAITVGVKGAFGAFDGGYELSGSFDAAGQGLLAGSDVKVHGVRIGEVKRIELIEGAAEVTLRIEDGEEVPEGATATIRPKTLFGEKFVDIDPGTAERGARLLEDGDRIAKTEGGFELERVLADTFPLLQAIDPDELMTVITSLAEGGDGLGDEINRTIENSDELSQVFAENAGNTEQFLEDLALLSDELVDQADTILEIADAGNAALPTLNENEDDLVTLLQQASRLSNDVADLLEANQPFVRASLVEGSRTLQLLYDQRTQVIPLVHGLRQYIETLTSVIRIPVGDGTLMGAVKGLLGGDACQVPEVECVGTGAASAGGPAPAPTPGAGRPETPIDDLLPGADAGAADQRDNDLADLLDKVLVG